MATAVIGHLHWADILVLVVYFIFVLIVGFLSSFKNRGSVQGYFLAGRNMHWIPVVMTSQIGASLFSSNIGSGHFIGLAGSAAATGIAISLFEILAIFFILLLGWVFVPVYISAQVFTMPEYLGKRFGGTRIRVTLSILSLLLYVFTKISADLYSGAIFINHALPINIYVSVIILLVVAALFTITGGLTAVIFTDLFQTVVMVIGAIILSVLSFIEVGGYDAMVTKYFSAAPSSTVHSNLTCGIPPKYAMHTIRGLDTALPWTGFLFGFPISAMWYWCSDQVIVQRTLAAKSLNHVKGASILACYLKMLPLFVMVFPGMIARILFPDEVACADPATCMAVCGSENGCTNIAYPKLVMELMPVGMRGLMLAVMMAALISSLTSIFNSTSTIFTIDIWCKIRKGASDVELMIVGRVCVLALVGVSVAWIPVVQNASELFHYINAIIAYLAPPVSAAFVVGIFWKRTNEKGAFWGMVVGLSAGMIRFVCEYVYTVPTCASGLPDPRPSIIKDVHYLHVGFILFLVSVLTSVGVSLLTRPIDDKYLVGLTYFDRNAPKDAREERKSKRLRTISSFRKGSTTDRPDYDGGEGTLCEIDEMKEDEDLTIGEQNPERNTRIGIQRCLVRTMKWLCGIEKMSRTEVRDTMTSDTRGPETKDASVWNSVCEVNAVILMVFTLFLWAFYF